jgi:hypothetical protein
VRSLADRRRALLLGSVLVAAAVVAQSSWLAMHYSAAYLDADLLSYLVYYRELRAGAVAPFGYTVPKLLPVLLLGPLASPELALAVSIGVAALGGALIFTIAFDAFGPIVAVLSAVAYVLDPLRAVLTLRSSVDLYMAVALLGAILALGRRAVFLAGAAILVAALGKPVAIACAAAILLLRDVPLRRRIAAAALPLAALPAIALLGAALEGKPLLASVVSFSLPDQHERFVRVAQGHALDALSALHLVFVEWFGGTLFSRTWPFAALGVLAALAVALLPQAAGALGQARDGHAPQAEGADGRRDRAATTALMLVVVPALLVAAYLGLSTVQPMIVFTRFFWLLAVALSVLAAFAAVRLAALAPGPKAIGAGVIAVFALALLADRRDDHLWRERLMLTPFEVHAAIAASGIAAIAHDDACGGPALVPLAYLPLAAWRAPAKLERGELCAVEDWADGRGCADPNCVLVIPAAPTTARAREAVARLVEDGGFIVEVRDGNGALVRSRRG